MLDSTGQIVYKNRFARDRGHHEIDIGQYPEGDVFGTCAAATLYRREMLQDIKMNNEYFDSDFLHTSKMWILHGGHKQGVGNVIL